MERGELKLGGENKVCTYEVTENGISMNLSQKCVKMFLKPGEKLKVILTSDSYFIESGSVADLFKDNIEILALVNDKPIYIGGFDVKEKRKKLCIKVILLELYCCYKTNQMKILILKNI